MNRETKRPQVGIGVIVMHEGTVLMQKRIGAHGGGDWSFPGGHLEFGESFEECAAREVFEEAGVTLRNISFAAATNDFFEKEQRQYVTIFMLADYESGEVIRKEEDRAAEWRWVTWGTMPEPLFVPIVNLLKQNFNPFTHE